MWREASLSAMGEPFDLDRVIGVAITHLHADHASGLEDFAYFTHFVLKRRATWLAYPDVSAQLWDGLLAAGMGRIRLSPDGVAARKELEDYVDLILEARGERFALPQSHVVELVRIAEPGEAAPGHGQPTLELVDGTPMLRLRDRILPLAHLGEILRLDGERSGLAGSIVVVLSVNGMNLGLVVDRVFDTEEIVVKPLSRLLRHLTMFGGKTILGDGSVIMILEPNGIARSLHLGDGAAHRPPALPVPNEAEHSDDLSAMLLFRTVPGAPPSAVPLALVARIETISRAQIEQSSGRQVIQYRKAVMPLISMAATPDDSRDSLPVLVFTDRGRSMGPDRRRSGGRG